MQRAVRSNRIGAEAPSLARAQSLQANLGRGVQKYHQIHVNAPGLHLTTFVIAEDVEAQLQFFAEP